MAADNCEHTVHDWHARRRLDIGQLHRCVSHLSSVISESYHYYDD